MKNKFKDFLCKLNSKQSYKIYNKEKKLFDCEFKQTNFL